MKVNSEKYHIESVRTHAAVVILVAIDVIVCRKCIINLEISLLGVLFDFATPYVGTEFTSAINTLSTSEPYWTGFRTTLFWISASLRILFTIETLSRIFFTDTSEVLSSPFQIFDAIVVITCLVLKFALSARNTLICNFLIAFRLARIWIILDYMFDQVEEQAQAKQIAVERHCQDLLKNSEIQNTKLAKKLENTQSKLNIMMGETQLDFDDLASTTNVKGRGGDRFSKLSFFE
ncbi:hypothetical protein HDV06_005059 [Boothiomyces sp. JEL0866]|nr:hypothetical protein HDV06_005059 [Boothiomyces sp. JEL0866]